MGYSPEYPNMGSAGVALLVGAMIPPQSAKEAPGTYFIPKPMYVAYPSECSKQYRWQQRKLSMGLCSICGLEPLYKGQRGNRCYTLMRLRQAMKDTARGVN
jgi:hypothetical protein